MSLEPEPFRWQDGERTIVFGPGAVAAVRELLGEGFELLTSDRAAAGAPELTAAARAVHRVAPGRVDELAADLLGSMPDAELIVALGGGRVIDTAKAVAAVRGARVGAIPTTLSGAEMTAGGRMAKGADPATPRRRPAVVIADPALAASQPESEQAASALNALGHAVEAPLTPSANPVATLAAHEAARQLSMGFPEEGGPRAASLTLGALLAGYAIDAAGYGLHHVMAQTLARLAGASHGGANAAMLPHTIPALRRRVPDRLEAFDAALGEPVDALARRLFARAGARTLGALGLEGDPSGWAAAAAKRPDLARTPPAADAGELEALYRDAL